MSGKYGEQVKIKYLDVIDDGLDEFPAVEQYLQKTGMHLPLLDVNGRIIRPGTGLSYQEIVEIIESMGLHKE